MKTQDFIFERMRAAQFYIPIGCNDLTVEINGSCQDVRLGGDGIDVTDLSLDEFKEWVKKLTELISALGGDVKDLEKNWPKKKS